METMEYNWIYANGNNRWGRISAINCDIREACAIESMANKGYADNETGDVESFHHYMLFEEKGADYIMKTNNQGFIYVKRFPKGKGKKVFDKLETEYCKLMEEIEGE